MVGDIKLDIPKFDTVLLSLTLNNLSLSNQQLVAKIRMAKRKAKL